MGPLIPLIFYTIAGLAVGTAIALSLVAARVRPPKWKLGWRVVPIGCAAAPVLGGLLLFLGVGLFNSLRPASAAFEEVFSRPPSPAVTGLQASTDRGWDYEDIFLAFDRNEAALAEVAKGRSFHSLLPDSAGLDTPEEALPLWWHGGRWTAGHNCPGGKVLVREGEGGWREVYIVDCPQRNKVYVRASNMD